MNILVCGGAGFIGSNFVRHAFARWPAARIVNFDKLTYAGNPANLADVAADPRYVFVQGDIVDAQAVESAMRGHAITHVVNFAAETHVDRSIHGGNREFVTTNSLGVQSLLDACRESGIELFLQVSTDEVYGSLELGSAERFTEGTPFAPNMPYAAAKAGGDLLCCAAWVTHRTPVVVTHCSNNYGPYQFPEKLIPSCVFRASRGERLPIYGDGLNVRDWIHVSDHCSALAMLLEKGAPGEVYNIGADNERSNLELARMLLGHFGRGDDALEYVEDRKGHDRRYAIDAAKIETMGWRPVYTRDKFAQGLKETVEWYLANAPWVEGLRRRQAEWDEKALRQRA